MGPNLLRRREFLRSLAASGVVAVSPGLAYSPDKADLSPPFIELLPSATRIDFVHTSGKSAQKYLPESTGAGCAFFDYDNDGWMDIYLVNSGPCDFWTPAKALRNALYHNNRDGTFTDVTKKAGVVGGGYGMGAAVGDYDGDGFPDLYVTQYGRSILYHNNGDGTFTDVTEKAGVAAPGWASSAVWFDYDNDGRLDLFVGRFVDFSKAKHHVCKAPNVSALAGLNEYCYPRIFDPMPSWLFHNNGDGTFTDVSQKMGIADNPGKAWGVVATDINNDGFLDLFVANDTTANFLFANRKGKRFEEIGFTAGVAYGPGGKARSGMGVDSADYDQDGWMDLFVTNLDHEFYGLYRNEHDESFADRAAPAGVARASQMMSGWGAKFFDFDNDGLLDLLIANGHPDDLIDKITPGVTYSEPLLLFRNTGAGLQDISRDSGPVFSRELSARGLALGDFDNDGAVDVLISVNDGAPLLLRNNAGRQNHWLGLNLVGKKSNSDAIGARITYQAGDLKQSRFKVGGGSYLSSHDPRIVLGLGKRQKIDWLEVKWPLPSGAVQRFVDLPINRYITIVEGESSWR
ncbi:MAG TPA: CRTAC1 family protein [Candidatus Acidoferrum sp.]|nr:CRTAC1 family protein [Candidatus Acidoferrum sp.]